jgi:hypothetical protein
MALQIPDPFPQPSKVGYVPFALRKQLAAAVSKSASIRVSPILLQTAIVHIAFDSCAPFAWISQGRQGMFAFMYV